MKFKKIFLFILIGFTLFYSYIYAEEDEPIITASTDCFFIPKVKLTNDKIREYEIKIENEPNNEFYIRQLIYHYYGLNDEKKLFYWCKEGEKNRDPKAMGILWIKDWKEVNVSLSEKERILKLIEDLSETGDSEANIVLFNIAPDLFDYE